MLNIVAKINSARLSLALNVKKKKTTGLIVRRRQNLDRIGSDHGPDHGPDRGPDHGSDHSRIMVGSFSDHGRIGPALEMTFHLFLQIFFDILQCHFSWQAQYIW